MGVTLDLILLIDQLLTVLRRRGAVLNLTSLRLQWDDLRYEVTREIESVRTEIDHVVAEAQTWVPGAAIPDRRRERQGSTRSDSSPQAVLSSSSTSLSSYLEPSLGASPTSQSTPLPTRKGDTSSDRSSSINTSPVRSSAPRSALHISILRSQLVGLQTRYHKLSLNLVKRSSAILDRMIDSASRLDELGGVDGPVPQEGKTRHGAIPDQLIDLQEELEAKAKSIAALVDWCGQIEHQSRKGYEHHAASVRAQDLTEEALGEIKEALGQPVSNSKHAVLIELFEKANSALPKAVDDAFPQPSHSEYPGKDVHNAIITATLHEARETAQAKIDISSKLLTYYASVLKAREALLAQRKRVQQLRGDLLLAVERLERGSVSAPRPSLVKVVEDGIVPSEWMSNIHQWLSMGETTQRAATDAHEATVLAIMQYRKAISNVLMAIKPHMPVGGMPDDLGQVVNEDATDVITLARRCAELTRKTRSESEALPLVLRIRQDSVEVAQDVMDLRVELTREANRAAWSGIMPSELPKDLDKRLKDLESQAGDIRNDMDIATNVDVSPEVLHLLSDRLTSNGTALQEAHRELDVFNRVAKQSQAVLDVQVEAEALVSDIVSAQSNSEETTTVELTALKARVAQWNESLTHRVPFVSGREPPTAIPTSRAGADGPLTPPMTPDGEEPSSTVPPDLARLDSRVRNEVNRQSLRVTSALASLVSASEVAAFEKWRAPVTKTIDSLQDATKGLQQHNLEVEKRLQSLHSAEAKERASLAEALRHDTCDTLLSRNQAVTSLVTAVDDTLESQTAAGFDATRAAALISAGGAARLSASAAVKQAESLLRTLAEISTPSPQRQSTTSPARPRVTEARPPAESKQSGVQQQQAIGLPTPSTSDDAVKAIHSLDSRLDALKLDVVVRPSPEQLRTPRNRRLPDPVTARELSRTLSDIADTARHIARSQPGSPAVGRLLKKVNTSTALLPDLKNIAIVAAAAADCDQAMSRLLNVIDSNAENDITPDTVKREVQAAVKKLDIVAQPFVSDPRVAEERTRINRTWSELRTLAEENPSLVISSASSDTTAASDYNADNSTPAPRRTARRATSSVNLRVNHSVMQPTVSSELKRVPTTPRATSDTTKGRSSRSRPSLESAMLSPPSLRSGPSHNSRSPSVSRAQPRLSLPQSSRLSHSTSHLSIDQELQPTPTRRSRSSLSSANLGATPRTDRAYTPNPKSRLDAAVARVLNNLDVSHVCKQSLPYRSQSLCSLPLATRRKNGQTDQVDTGSVLGPEQNCASAVSYDLGQSWSALEEAGWNSRDTLSTASMKLKPSPHTRQSRPPSGASSQQPSPAPCSSRRPPRGRKLYTRPALQLASRCLPSLRSPMPRLCERATG